MYMSIRHKQELHSRTRAKRAIGVANTLNVTFKNTELVFEALRLIETQLPDLLDLYGFNLARTIVVCFYPAFAPPKTGIPPSSSKLKKE